jgi:hypothetical protein
MTCDTLSLSIFPRCLRCGVLRGVVPEGACACGCWLVMVDGEARSVGEATQPYMHRDIQVT